MKRTSRTEINKNRVLLVISGIFGIPLAWILFPFAFGNQKTVFEKAMPAVITWMTLSFFIYLVLLVLHSLFISRKSILKFLTNPYTWKVILTLFLLSILPWLVNTLIHWSEIGANDLKFYAIFCMGPVLLIGMVAAAKLSPRLDFGVLLRLLAGGAILLVGSVGILVAYFAIFFQPTVYPTRGELISLLSFYWLSFLAVWYIWSRILKLRVTLPQRIRTFISSVTTFQPNGFFVIISFYVAVLYPLAIIALGAIYREVLNSIGVLFEFTDLDRTAWRVVLGIPSCLIGITYLLFICYSSIRLIRKPAIAMNIHHSPVMSAAIALISLFVHWWIYFTSTAAWLNFLKPGEYLSIGTIDQSPKFIDFIFYTIGVMTSNNWGNIQAPGNIANFLAIVMYFTGWILLAVLVAIIVSLFSEKLPGKNRNDQSPSP